MGKCQCCLLCWLFKVRLSNNPLLGHAFVDVLLHRFNEHRCHRLSSSLTCPSELFFEISSNSNLCLWRYHGETSESLAHRRTVLSDTSCLRCCRVERIGAWALVSELLEWNRVCISITVTKLICKCVSLFIQTEFLTVYLRDGVLGAGIGSAAQSKAYGDRVRVITVR